MERKIMEWRMKQRLLKMERKIMEWRMKQRLLELDVDAFFYRVGYWSRILSLVAIIIAVVGILIPAIIRIMGR